MLKKLILTCLLTGAMAVPSVFAVPTVTFSDGPGTTGGGEFNATTSANGNFVTFCLELNEHVQMNTPSGYYYQINTATTSGPDPISLATAWLYNQFLNGTLTGYIGDNASADLLQNAIWFLEDEGGANNSYVADALVATGVNGKTTAANGAYGVKVMNVYQNYDETTGKYSGRVQDQLIRVPDGGTTLALLGMSMGFVALASRRMRR